MKSRPPALILLVAGAALVFLVLPVAGLVQRAPWSSLGHELASSDVRSALGLSLELAEVPDAGAIVGQSARNRFTGVVTRVVKDKVAAQVEIQAGPHRVVSLMTREAADELELAPGMLAVAAVKATNVVVELPADR